MENSKIYTIKKWSNWLDELAEASRNFYQTFDAIPLLLEATEHTLSQFEFMTEIAPIGNEIKNLDTNKLGTQTEKPSIRELTFKDEFTMTFKVNNELKDKTFKLKSDFTTSDSEMVELDFEIYTEENKELIITNETIIAGD